MQTEHRHALLSILARLDQVAAHADAILAEPVYATIHVRAEELRELLADMRAVVEAKLDDAG